MRKCGNAEMRKCGNVKMRKYGNAEMRKCGNADMRKCGNAEFRSIPRKCGNAEMRNAAKKFPIPLKLVRFRATPRAWVGNISFGTPFFGAFRFRGIGFRFRGNLPDSVGIRLRAIYMYPYPIYLKNISAQVVPDFLGSKMDRLTKAIDASAKKNIGIRMEKVMTPVSLQSGALLEDDGKTLKEKYQANKNNLRALDHQLMLGCDGNGLEFCKVVE